LRSLQADDCVSWRVNLTNTTEAGDYRLALRLEDAILTAGNLWFWRDDDLRPIRVDVDLPEQAALSVPWKERVDSSGKTYYLPGRTPFSWSSKLAIGYFKIRRIPVGGTGLRLAVLGDTGSKRPEDFATWIDEAAQSVASVYGRFPQSQPQVLVVAVGRQRDAVPWARMIRGGGAAVEFFVDPGRPFSEFREDWTATHELSHMLLPYVSSRDRWLSEGMASYYQNVLRSRDGRLSEEQAWQKLDAGFERGKRATQGGSLARASRSGRSSTMRVYWGGAAIMLKADAQLRAISQGRHSLDSALESLHDCCFEEGKTWRAKHLFAELDRLTTHDVFTMLYNEHALDDAFPDVDRTYSKLGVVRKSGSISLDPRAPWERIRDSIMHGPPAASSASGSR
jgi:hypothetical protein